MHAGAIDVLVRGAGPVGCALALALRRSRLRVALLGHDAPSAFRPLALSYASRLILERLGVWPLTALAPIASIHVTQQGGFGAVRLDARDAGVPALGYVTEYSALVAALARENVCARVDAPPPARLVVHAEGAAPQAREKRYAQDALVAWVRTEPSAAEAAFERFTPEGPLAMLPCAGGYAVVWTCAPGRARELLEASPEAFTRALGQAAGTRPGRPIEVRHRGVVPLVLRVQRPRVVGREVY
ncbi:MAG TPA: 2-octaprenyl-6-methoxyphenyl hydroxylase, partial [Burkholderiales bacterium]|nr:2-octaprenyl-6-methoxyphenyl hydroxylase [Burkholderiales bacterium]